MESKFNLYDGKKTRARPVRRVAFLALAGIIAFTSYGLIKSCSSSKQTRQAEQQKTAKIENAAENITAVTGRRDYAILMNDLEQLSNDKKASEEYADKIIEIGIKSKERFNFQYGDLIVSKLVNIVENETKRDSETRKNYLLRNADLSLQEGYGREIWEMFPYDEKSKMAKPFIGEFIKSEAKEAYAGVKNDTKKIYQKLEEKGIPGKIKNNAYLLINFLNQLVDNKSDSGGS